MVPFGKMTMAKYKSKGAIIAEQILLKIESGEYPSGSRLPAERLISELRGGTSGFRRAFLPIEEYLRRKRQPV